MRDVAWNRNRKYFQRGVDVAALEASLVETRRHRDESLADAARERAALQLELQRQKEEVTEARRRVREAERARDAGADASGGLVSRLDDAERTVRDLQQKLNAARNDNDALRSQKESHEDLQRERERDVTLLRSRADTAEARCRDLDSRLRTVADERDRQKQRADEFEADLAGRGSRDGEVNALKRELEAARRDAQRRRDDDALRSTQLTKIETDRLEAKCKALESDVEQQRKRADAAQIELERLATRPDSCVERGPPPCGGGTAPPGSLAATSTARAPASRRAWPTAREKSASSSGVMWLRSRVRFSHSVPTCMGGDAHS